MDDTPGSCPSGETSNPVNVRLVLVDDDSDLILDKTRSGVVCTSGDTTYVKFAATFEGPVNCKGSVAPGNFSRGDVDATVTTIPDNGSLNVTRSILCKGGNPD
jgi:hypothetical protein